MSAVGVPDVGERMEGIANQLRRRGLLEQPRGLLDRAVRSSADDGMQVAGHDRAGVNAAVGPVALVSDSACDRASLYAIELNGLIGQRLFRSETSGPVVCVAGEASSFGGLRRRTELEQLPRPDKI
jgi:hypothetical protein